MPPRPELRAAALGLLQGAAELLPVSSSAHVAAVPWLLGWDALEPARQKELEVALHFGALLALAPTLWRLAPSPRTLALSLAPPVVAGYVFERPIESRLGSPAALAGGLLVGAAALAAADCVPADADGRGGGWSGPRRGGQASATLRDMAEKGLSPGALGRGRVPARDALLLGLAQAAALAPGVSRTGATLAAARALGYSRPEALRLSFGVAGPVLAGATALKAWRGRPWTHWRAPAAGAAAAFVATGAALRVVGLERRGPLWPYAAERALLATVLLAANRVRPL
jgi:undecaprenyl-diphosphatase